MKSVGSVKTTVSPRSGISALSKEFAEKLPCGVALAGILCALLPEYLFPELKTAAVLLPPLATLAVLPLLGAEQTLFKFALPSLLAMGSLTWHAECLKRDPVTAFAQDRPAVGAVAELTIADPSVCGVRLRWMPAPKNIFCRIERASYSIAGKWQQIGGYVMVRLPRECPILRYGDRLLAEGVLEEPAPPVFPGGFDYGSYLKTRGVRRIFRLTGPPEIIGYKQTCTGRLLDVRDILLERLLSPIDSLPNKTLAAAMLFGCRQGIEYETRRDFIRSGTIHILTVSGLHIGMFAGVMFLLLSFLPLRTRCLLVPLLTALYAWSTGLQMPAFRALAMLCSWCFLRAFLLRGAALNSVFLACALLLVWNPFQLADPGFQYSFTAVIFLVASLPATREWADALLEKTRWIPADHTTRAAYWRIRLVRSVFAALAGCVIAWVASFGLTLLYQGITVPFSVLANFLVLPLSWLCFFVFCLGSILGALFPPLLPLGTWFLNLLAGMINGVCAYFAGLGEFIRPEPAPWSVAVSLLLFMTLICSRSRRTAFSALALLGIILFVWCADLFRIPKPEAAVVSGGGMERPSVLVSLPAYDFSILVNAPDFTLVREAVAHLKRRGHASLTYLILTSGRATETRGAKYLFPVFRVENLVMMKPAFNAAAAKEAYATAYENGVRTFFPERSDKGEYRFRSQEVQTFMKNGDFLIAISRFAFKLTVKIRQEDHRFRVSVYDGTGKCTDALVLPRMRERSLSILTVQKESVNRL